MNWFRNVFNFSGAYVMQILGAVLLLLLAFVVAFIVKAIVEKLLIKGNLDKHLAKGTEPYNLEKGKERVSSIGKIAFLLVFILFLPSILDRLDMRSVSLPITNMMNGLLGFIPHLIGAAIVLFAGYFVAKIIRDLTKTFLMTVEYCG